MTRYLAWKGLFPHRGKGSPFFWVGTIGVGLGVMLLVLVLSVMQGFGATYRQKIVELGGDLRIEKIPLAIIDALALDKRITEVPNVEAASEYAQGFMMIEHARRPAFPIVKGIDPIKEKQIVPFEKNELIKEGSLEALDEDGVLLSSLLARQIGANVGDEIEVYTPMMISRLQNDELLLPRPLTVVGLYETGWHDFDQNTMLIHIDAFRDLYGLGTGAHGITVRLVDSHKLNESQAALREALPGYTVTSWKEIYKDFLWVLDLERNMMFFLMIFVIVVAAFAMGAAQLMTVLRKTRQIGLMLAMGATQRVMAGVYALQGFMIGVSGVIFGNILALVILYFRNDILHAIAHWTGTYDTLVNFYQFYDLPMSYGWVDAISIGAWAILLTTLSGLIPAILITKLKPAQALRNE